jgi:hypothetical protein
LVLGTVLTFFVDPEAVATPPLLFGGVALGFLAVVAIAVADRLKQQGHYEAINNVEDAGGGRRRKSSGALSSNSSGEVEEATVLIDPPSAVPPAKPGPVVSVATCLAAGLLMSCWAPLSTYSLGDGDLDATGLNPYSSFLLFAAAVLLTSSKPSPLALFLVNAPMGEPPTTPAAYYELGTASHGR